MWITSLKMVGCVRLLRFGINVFVLTPEQIIQIILGTNGSGKSSVMNELSPMPGDKNDYVKTGMKEFKCVHRGSHYILTSTFASTSPKHSFIQDEVERNPGMTEAVQLDLIKEHFGIDKAIHNLQRGEEKFTEMSPARRREWLTRLSVADYTFAMDTYEMVRGRNRESANALKRNSANLVIETAKIISSDEEERLEKEVRELHEQLTILTSERMPLEQQPSNVAQRRDRVLSELENLSLRLLSSRIIAPFEYTDGVVTRDDWGDLIRTSYKSIDQVDLGIDTLKHKVTTIETTISTATEQFNKLQKNYDILLKAGQDGVANLAKQYEGLEIERRALLQRRKLELDILDAEPAHRAYESILPRLQELFNTMPMNSDRRLGRERMLTLQTERFNLEETLNELRNKIAKAQAQIDHADHHRGKGRVACPECRHEWDIGVNENEYARTKELLKTLHEELDLRQKQVAKLLVEIKEIDDYFEQYREFMGFVKNVTILEPFWSYLIAGKYVTDVPKEAINQTRIFQRDLEYTVQAQRILTKMDEIAKLRIAAEQVGDTSIQEVKEEMDLLSTKLGLLTAQLTKLRQSVSDYSEYRRQLNLGQQLGEQVKQLYEQAHQLEESYIEALRRESILHCIHQVESALGLKEESLRNAKMQKAIVGKLQEHVNQLALEEEATKEMMRALSPTHGLIAEGLLGFIRSFVGQMNSFIKKIWTYPLQVLPTGFADGEQSTELDYKFKMLSGDSINKPVPDVSKGSEAQKEVVNLAFKMTSIHYLGLSNFPLFLDEFGRTFDDAHRNAATHAIKSLMENYNHSQLFMVSHYAASYGAFNNAEICVMDKRNLALPSTMVYNKHVVIE